MNDGALWGGNTAGDAGISVAGIINAKNSVVIAAAKSNIKTESGSVIQTGAAFNAYTKDQAADTYRTSLVNTNGIVDATTAVATSDSIALVAKKNIHLAGNIASHGRSINAETGDNLTIAGTANTQSRLTSGGGTITLTASSGDAKLQAKPSERPGDGMISIKDAYIDSSSENQNSGSIDITAVRNVMGVSRIDVDDSTITAEGKNGHQAGNVSIHATAETKLYAWDIGDGAYALIKMGQDSRGKNVIKGDNVDISARASTSGVIGDDHILSDAEIKAGIEREKDHNAILGLLEEYGGNFRTFGSATKTYAEANVDIDKTDITAVGNGTSEAEHGDVKITSDAQSDIAPFNLNLVSFGFNVGIGNVKSSVHVDDSQLSAAKNISLKAEGTNTVNMSLMDFNVIDPLFGSSFDFSWAQINSDIATSVGEKATLTSQGNVDISAKSIRTLKSGASNCGNTLAAAVGIGIADTKATAEMAGTVYAKGDVSVKAENTLAESGGVYAADTVTAASIGGDSAMKPTTDPLFDSIENGAKKVAEKVKKFFTGEDKTGQIAKDLDLDAPEENPKPANKKKPWNKLGFNASTALLFSENDANASVTGMDVTGNAELTSRDAMELADAHAGSVTAKAGTTLTVKNLISTDKADLTSNADAKLDNVRAGILTAISTAGNVTAGMLTTTTGNANVTAKNDITIGMLNAENGNTELEATDGTLNMTTLQVKDHAKLTSGKAMTLEKANAGSITAKAGTTLQVKQKLQAVDKASLTSDSDMTLEEIQTDSVRVNADGKLVAKTLGITGGADLTSRDSMELLDANVGSMIAKAGTTLQVKKLIANDKVDFTSDGDMKLHDVEAGNSLMANADGSILSDGINAQISAGDIQMTASEEIRMTDRPPVGKLSGVDTSILPRITTGSGSAGSFVTGEAIPHDFDVSKKGHVQLLSTNGKVNLSAKNVEIDALANGNGASAELTISANHIGIDDLTSSASKQHVTIHGSDGKNQARYAGIHNTAKGGILIKDSAVEHLNVTGIEPIGLTNTAIGGDSIFATEKIRVTIDKNPKSNLAEYIGNLHLNGYNITIDHLLTSIKDGLTVNGERFPKTADSIMNTNLYNNRLLGSDGKKKAEKESRKSDSNLVFANPTDKESFAAIK